MLRAGPREYPSCPQAGGTHWGQCWGKWIGIEQSWSTGRAEEGWMGSPPPWEQHVGVSQPLEVPWEVASPTRCPKGEPCGMGSRTSHGAQTCYLLLCGGGGGGLQYLWLLLLSIKTFYLLCLVTFVYLWATHCDNQPMSILQKQRQLERGHVSWQSH